MQRHAQEVCIVYELKRHSKEEAKLEEMTKGNCSRSPLGCHELQRELAFLTEVVTVEPKLAEK